MKLTSSKSESESSFFSFFLFLSLFLQDLGGEKEKEKKRSMYKPSSRFNPCQRSTADGTKVKVNSESGLQWFGYYVYLLLTQHIHIHTVTVTRKRLLGKILFPKNKINEKRKNIYK